MVKRTRISGPEELAGILDGGLRPIDGKSELEEALAFQLGAAKIGGWKRELCWHQHRQWRSDFVFPAERLIVELEGGQWSSGRHTRGGGFEADCEKYNEAAVEGWTVLRFTTSQVVKGGAVKVIKRWLLRWARS